MLSQRRSRIAFKTISALMAGIFLFNQVAWAGDLINAALEQQYKEQSQTFAPAYLKAQQAAAEGLIDQKQAVVDTIAAQDATNSTAIQPSTAESLDLKGPTGGSVSQPSISTASVQTAAEGDAASLQDGAVLSVTTQAGDIIHYKNGAIDYIERAGGVTLRNIVVDDNNNLIGARITLPDKTVQVISNGRVSQVIYPGGYSADCSYVNDDRGNIIETILTDTDKVSRYDSNNRLTRVEYNTGKIIEYDSGVISRITDPDNGIFSFDITVNPDNTVTSALSRYTALSGDIYRYGLNNNDPSISVSIEKDGLTALYDGSGSLVSVTKDNQVVTKDMVDRAQADYNNATNKRRSMESWLNSASGGILFYMRAKDAAYARLRAAVERVAEAQEAVNIAQENYSAACRKYNNSISRFLSFISSSARRAREAALDRLNAAIRNLNAAQAEKDYLKKKYESACAAVQARRCFIDAILYNARLEESKAQSRLNALSGIFTLSPAQDNVLKSADDSIGLISVAYDADRGIKRVNSFDGSVQDYSGGLPENVSSGSSATLYSYDISALGSINSVTIDRDGVKRIYDEYGELSSVTADGVSVAFSNGNIARVEKEDGTVIEDAVFDQNGNIISATITNPAGVKAFYEGGVVRQTDQPDGTKLYYDADRNLTHSVDGKGVSYTYAKRVDGGIEHLIATADSGAVIDYTYIKDAEDNIVSTIANDGKIVTTYDGNNVIQRTEVLPTPDDPVSTISEYEYDRIRRVYKGNELIYRYSYEFDSSGAEITVIEDVATGDLKRYKDETLISVTGQDGLVTTYGYDSDKRISVSTVSYLDKIISRYTYSYEGENTIIEDTDGVRRAYDNNDKLVSLEEGGNTYAYTYNIGADGKEETVQELVKVKDNSGAVANYDKGVLKSIVKTDGTVLGDFVFGADDLVASYSILKDGVKCFVEGDKIVLAESFTGPDKNVTEYSYKYSGAGTVDNILVKKNNLIYTYDSNGTLQYVIDDQGSRYYYNNLNQLARVVNALGEDFSFNYTGDQGSIFLYNQIEYNTLTDMAGFTTNDTVLINSNNLEIKLDRNYGFDFGDGSDGDLRVEAGQTIVVDGTKNYKSIYIAAGATLTVSPWDGTSGGDLQIKCLGSVVIDGAINVDAKGYRGGSGRIRTSSCQYGYECRSLQGESPDGDERYSGSANYGGGGGGGYAYFAGRSLRASGAGGSYGTIGASGNGGGRLPTTGTQAYTVNIASAGSVYGDPTLSTIYMGSGGGAGYEGSSGGSGGGIIKLSARSIDIKGTISSNGGRGSSDAGGGSGGSVWLEGKDVSVEGSVSASGGICDRQGGDGRIRIDYGTFSGNIPATASYMAQVPYGSHGSFISTPCAITATELGYVLANTNTPAGTSIRFETRTGASSNLDDGSWSAWVEVPKDASGYKINSPVDKYIQYQAILETEDVTQTPSINSNGDYAIKFSYSYNKIFDATAPPGDLLFREYLKLTPPDLPIAPQIDLLNIDSSRFNGLGAEIEGRMLPDDTVIQTKSFKDDLGHDVALQISKDNKFTYSIDGKMDSTYQKYGDGHVELVIKYSYDADGNLASVNMPSARDSIDTQIATARQQIAKERADYLRTLTAQKGLAYTQIRDQVQAIRDQINTQRSQLQSQLYQEVTRSRWVGWWIFGWYETYTETVEVPGVRSAINQLNEQERQLNDQESDAYAQLDTQVSDAEKRLDQDETDALAAVAAQESQFHAQIVKEEATPVILDCYRSVLGRDPDEAETNAWLATVDYNSGIDADSLRTTLLNSGERQSQQAFVVGLKNRIDGALRDYLLLDDIGKRSLLSSLGLSASDTVTLGAGDIDAIISLLDKQSIHFGRSAFVALGNVLTNNGITYNLEDLAIKTVLVDILTGSLNKFSEGTLLELSMYALSKTASTYGIELNNTRLNYDDLTQVFNTSGQAITHLKNNHYVTVANIASDGKITYKENNRGQNGYIWTVSRQDFENSWTGYAIVQKTSLKGTLPESVLAKKISDDTAMRVKGSCLPFLFPLLGAIFGAIAGAATAVVGAISAIVTGISAVLAPIISGIGSLITGIAGFMTGIGTAVFNAVSFVGTSLMPVLGQAGSWLSGIGSFLGNSFGLGGVISSTGFNLTGLGLALGKTVVSVALSIGISKGLEALGVDSTISGLLSSFVTGGVSGIFNNGFSALSFITGGVQGLAIQGVNELAPRLGIDPMLSNVISLTAGSVIGAIGNNISPTTGEFDLEGFSASIGRDVMPSATSEFAYYGITKAGELLGVDPRISYLAGAGIRSTINAGLQGADPNQMWTSITNGLLQGVTNIGLNFATKELGISPLLANIGFSAISGAINAGIQAATGGNQDVFQSLFKTYTDNALTFLGYGDPSSAWQQAAYISQILDFSNIVQERGLVDALNTYGAGFFNAVAVNNIVQSGYTLGGYFAEKLASGQYTDRILQDGTQVKEVAVKNGDNILANAFFQQKQTGEDVYWDLIGGEELVAGDSYLSWGNFGIDPCGKLGYTDAQLYSVFNSDIQYQRVIDGQQTYAEVKDWEGNTLLVIEPTAGGICNAYNSYGEYVEAMISAPVFGLDEKYLFDDSMANYYQEDADIAILGDDGGNVLTDVGATLRVTLDENGNVENRELVVDGDFYNLLNNEDGILLLNQFGNEIYIPFSISALSPGPNTKKVVYFVHNGINNPQREGVAPLVTRKFRDELVRQGVDEKTIFLEPLYEREERGKPREDIQRWLKDSLFNEDIIADEIFQKYLAVYQLLTPEERAALKVGVTYSGSFNPYLRAIEKYNMNIETIVNYGGQSIKGVFSGYEINNTHIKNVINIWGENDFYGKLVQEKNFTNVNMINIELKGADHSDFNIEGRYTGSRAELNQKAARFNVYITRYATNPQLITDVILKRNGVAPIYKDGKIIKYEVDLSKFNLEE